MDSLLLIYLPIFSALVVSVFAFKIFKNSLFFNRLNKAWFTLAAFAANGLSLFLGGALGLLLSVQINRIFFDYQALKTALPSGILVWYGFGPGLTPQFMNYWAYVQFSCLIAFVVLVVFSFKNRNKRIVI